MYTVRIAGKLELVLGLKRLHLHTLSAGALSLLTLSGKERLVLLGRIHGGLLPRGSVRLLQTSSEIPMHKVKDELFLGRRCRKILLARRRRQGAKEMRESARHGSTDTSDRLATR